MGLSAAAYVSERLLIRDGDAEPAMGEICVRYESAGKKTNALNARTLTA